MSRSVRVFALLVVTLFAGVVAAACVTVPPEDVKETTIVRIFHHGSILPAMIALEEAWEHKNPHIDIRRERTGSGSAIAKVTDQGRVAELVMGGDYAKINAKMIPDHADWFIRYSTNAMVLAIAKGAAHGSTITADNWYDIVRKDDVSMALADPNTDPGGYRAVMAMYHAESHYGDSAIFDDLVLEQSTITLRTEGAVTVVQSPSSHDLDPRLVFRPNTVSLFSLIETGEVDYAWLYKSEAEELVASGAIAGYLDLPGRINLADTGYSGDYGTVSIEQFSDDDDNKILIPGRPIVNGFTIPKTAKHVDEIVDFLLFLLGPEGDATYERIHISPLEKPETNAIDKVPERLRPLLVEISEY